MIYENLLFIIEVIMSIKKLISYATILVIAPTLLAMQPPMQRRKRIVPLYIEPVDVNPMVTDFEEEIFENIQQTIEKIPSTTLKSGVEAYDPADQNTLYRTIAHQSSRCLKDGEVNKIPQFLRMGRDVLDGRHAIFVKTLLSAGPNAHNLDFGINSYAFKKYLKSINKLLKKNTENLSEQDRQWLRGILLNGVYNEFNTLNGKNAPRALGWTGGQV